jgi:hypothetical protein
MIRVAAAPEPPAFDERVRQPGLGAIAELAGEPPTIERPGPRRRAVATNRDEIPSRAFPDFWREAIADLLEAYGRVCAYACLYIERTTGSATVDHWAPRSTNGTTTASPALS